MLDSGLLEAAGHALEAMHRLLPEPLHDASSAIAVGDVIAERGKTLRFAALLHVRQLLNVKLLVSDRSPIVFRVVHEEARRKRSICSDDQPVLSGAAAPVFADTAHEAFHVLEAGE